MPERALYIASYDVADPGRLAQSLRAVRAYATGGQLSVHECFLSAAERAALWRKMGRILRRDTDSFFLLRLDPRSEVRVLGVAIRPKDPPLFFLHQ